MSDNLVKWLRSAGVSGMDEAADRIEKLEAALRACHSALNVAFEYDGNVFGFAHNDAVDADILASKALEGKDD